MMMRRCFVQHVAAFLLLSAASSTSTTTAFQPPQSFSRQQQQQQRGRSSLTTTALSSVVPADHDNENDSNNNDKNDNDKNNAMRRHRSLWQRRFRPAAAALLSTTALLTALRTATTTTTTTTTVAHASAPVMALPKAEDRDPMTDAMIRQEKINQQETQKELQQMAQTARKIEQEQGEKARIRYEQEFKAQQQAKADAKQAAVVQLKRELLDQGIDPFTDIEGRRQVVLLEKGVDLGEVAGTPFHLEKTLERTKPKRSVKVQKAVHRQVVACMVQDLKNRGIDPLEYMERHTDKTNRIMDLPAAQAAALLQQYQANLEQYGQITVPAEGEMSAKETMAANQDPKAVKEEAKRVQAAEKAAKKAEQQRLKAEQKAAKRKAKEEAKAAKEEAKKEQQAAKAAAAAAAAGTAAAAGAAAAAASGVQQAAGATADALSAATPEVPAVEQGGDLGGPASGVDGAAVAEAPDATVQKKKKQSDGKLPIVPVSAAFVAVGGGGYAFKMYRDKAAEDEAERQRQFKLLMEGDADTTAPPLEVIDEDVLSSDTPAPKKKKTETPPPAAAAATKEEPPRKKRLGIKKVFGKKKNDRETDLSAVVGSGAKANEFATVLAKILTYGAPGRFPGVLQLPGDMPMDTFDLEKAKEILSNMRVSEGLTLEESAEVFANVVNCMLIDIVDLASSSLKEENDDLTVKSINIVVDFMNHAASLYDSIAKDVIIKPVTYGGDLSKSKLEQMYSTYTVSGMMGMFGGKADGDSAAGPTDDFDSRVALLQDVFQISEKKAEGLMMKAVQKNMMEMMKDGKGMEGMEEMLGGMGDMGGLAGGMPGMGADGEPSPEQLKEMLTSLKQMKDSGSIPPSEFEEVKKQFKEAFGSGLDEVVKDAGADGELSETEKELLELMKAIMDD